jgi:predicted helicase
LKKEDIVYYVYSLLHAPDYRQRFVDNLGRELPRIPCVKSAADFWAISRAGRQLADLHLQYENVPMYPAKVEGDDLDQPPRLQMADYRVEKMRYRKAPTARTSAPSL